MNNPADFENWWIWLMLFSTAIPSVVNLAIASFAFLRGVPFVTKWMLSRMPENAAMRPRDQMRVAAALAGQVAIGLLLTASLLYLLFDDVVPLALPWLGAIIRGFSEQIAAYNAPAHVMKWLAGTVVGGRPGGGLLTPPAQARLPPRSPGRRCGRRTNSPGAQAGPRWPPRRSMGRS